MPPKKQPLGLRRCAKADSNESLTITELKIKDHSLRKQSAKLDREIAALRAQGITEDLRPEMEALHEYNDVKDVTQMILGYLADLEHCSVTELHKRYGLPLEGDH